MSELVRFSKNPHTDQLVGDVIFVHGLGGDASETWGVPGDCWLSWLVDDLPDLCIWSLQYSAPAIDWKGSAMPLTDRALNVLAVLDSQGIGARPIVFITHSYGGLLVKQLLRSARDLNEPRWRAIQQQTRGVIFLSTPHSGVGLATWVKHLGTLLGASVVVKELESNESHLRDLNLWYRSNVENLKIATEVYFEKEKTAGIRVVDETTSDPGLSGVIPVPMDANHWTISKPTSRESVLYARVRRFLSGVFAGPSPIASAVQGLRAVAKIITSEPKAGRTRPEVLDMAQSVSGTVYPDAAKPFPEGTFFKPQHSSDHIYYVLSRPTAALRSTIAFMQKWHETAALGFPDCTVVLDVGEIGVDLSVGPVVTINSIKTRLTPGKVYVTKDFAESCDQTLAKFASRGTVRAGKSKISLYEAIFDDPRTTPDSALVHALFVAAPEAKQARDRLFELFLVEYLLEHNRRCRSEDFYKWARSKNYPLPPAEHLNDRLADSVMVSEDAVTHEYYLSDSAVEHIEFSRLEYEDARLQCCGLIEKSVRDATGTPSSTKAIDIPAIVDQYLSAIFLEVRMMANYFRRGYAIFETASESFTNFDYIIKQRLPDGSDEVIEPWRRGFILGLKKACEANNLYIASVFHNVLATYYLNRSASTSPYQLTRLTSRVVYIDTNVLYALRVQASSYHELVEYLLRNLAALGISIKVFPFTIEEYESSLLSVENCFDEGTPRPELIRWNPWLFQEYMLRPGRYVNRISVCREVHRIKKNGVDCTSADYDAVDTVLAEHGISLERSFDVLADEEISELWSEYSHKMPSNAWSLDEYWEFLYRASALPMSKKRHDVHCLVNVGQKTRSQSTDELGPRTLFLTLDRNRLLRLRKILRYIAGAEQLLEFFLPYFFLKDIPVSNAEAFPNELLSAHLGTLLVKRPPKIAEVAEAYCRDSGAFEGSRPGVRVSEIEAVASAMNDSRFTAIAKAAKSLPDEQGERLREQFGATLEEIKQAEVRSFYERASEELEMRKLRLRLAEAEEQLKVHESTEAKLHRTVKYWKGQAKGRQ